MKQLIVDFPDHVPNTTLIDFITTACNFYFHDCVENLEDGDPEISYLEELLDAVNNMGFDRYSSEMTDVWQLNTKLRDDGV